MNRKLISIWAAAAALFLAPVGAIAEDAATPDEFVSNPAAPDDRDGAAAAFVAPQATPGKRGERPTFYAGMLLVYDFGDLVERCAAQFISDHVILTAASCVSNGSGRPWTGPFDFYQDFYKRDFLELYSSRCSLYYSAWKGERGGDYRRDYAMIYSRESSRTGSFNVKIPAQGGPAKALDYQRGRPVIIPGQISDAQNGEFQFVPRDSDDEFFGPGGGWIKNYSRDSGRGLNVLTSITSHVDGQGRTYGPALDDKFTTLFDQIKKKCN